MTPETKASYDRLILQCAAERWEGRTQLERHQWFLEQVDALIASTANAQDQAELHSLRSHSVDGFSMHANPDAVIEMPADPKLTDSSGDDEQAFGHVDQVDTNPGGDRPAELLGVCFGDLVPNLPCVLVGLQVRLVTTDGAVREGERDPIMFDYSVLATLRDNLPMLLQHMEAVGSNIDRMEPPRSRMPAWNEGPRFRGPIDLRAICTGFGFFEETLPAQGAAMAYIELNDVARNETSGGRYIVPHRALLQLRDALPKVLRKMEQKGHHKDRSLH